MSSAIALQSMAPQSHTQEAGTLRQRSSHKADTKLQTSTAGDDGWVETPQDTQSVPLPLDSRSCVPTKTYWITPHGMLTKEIKILDLTKDMDISYSGLTNDYKAAVKRTLKDHSFTPFITCQRKNWIGLQYEIVDDQGNQIGHWKHPWVSTGEAVLSFPLESTYCSHPVSLANKRWGFRAETFTVNSQLYIWGMDSVWHSTNMTLYKVYGTGDNETKIEIGKYAQKWWGGVITGGTLVIDDKELDGALACLTLAVVLKKKRQRNAERNSGGGE